MKGPGFGPLPVIGLTASGFKGCNISHGFGAPITIFTGPNSVGKSSRVEALLLGLTGYVPTDSGPVKQGRAIFDTFGDPRIGKLSVTVEYRDPDTLEYKVAKRQWSRTPKGSVTATGDKEPVVPAVYLDPATFFAMTGPERTRYLFSVFARNLDPAKLLAQVAADAKGRIPAGMPRAEELVRDAVSAMPEWAMDEQVQDWLVRLVAQAKDNLAAANQSVKRLSETVRGNTEVQSQTTPPPADAEQVFRAAADSAALANAEVDKCRRELEAARASWREAKAASELLAKNTEVARLCADVPALEARVAQQVASPDRGPVSEATNQLYAAKREMEQAADAKGAAQVALRLAETHGADRVCPTCNQQLPEPQQDELDRLTLALDEAKVRHQAASEKHEAARGELERLEADYQRAQAAADAWSKDARLLNEVRRSEAAVLQYKEAASKLPEHGATGRQLGEKLPRLEQAAHDAAAARNRAEAGYKALVDSRAQQAAAARLQESLEEAEAGKTAAGAVYSAAAAVQEKVANDACGPLVTTVNALCEPILPGKFWLEDGEMMLGHHPVRSCSDSEKLLVYAALCVALAAESPFKLVLIGRLESFDATKRPQLLELLAHLVQQDVIAQAILVGVQTGTAPEQYGPALDGLLDVQQVQRGK